ncbi:2,3,4,5-tetrahydropyridine-2,6-dicarboxylate N-succinyltransferase [Saccharospirillum sp. HFRX-1]|uniref:2,3,4,5-tetrahydropyridine-2,6-dicarboxylate N-succinyltransferase n=1 Tax=unclassified Saccharospirillum TaxID=2633430 RepID=UPI0037179A49
MSYFALAVGTATRNKDGKIIEAWFPEPILNPADALVAALTEVVKLNGGNEVFVLESAQMNELASRFSDASQSINAQFCRAGESSHQTMILVALESDSAPSSVAEVFLKLQLISHRLVQPHGCSLEGMFALLHNIAWTSEGPIDLPELAERQMEARLAGRVLEVNCVDKFPKLADYIVPTGVRIADTARVRLGAHLGEGTTVMHEGFVNFNAGTAGASMVEGRISAGVMVGEGSDVGGGASIMGTLSGGGKVVVSMGQNSLLGANSGVGIPLGDRCTVEAGLYITAGTKVTLLDSNKQAVETVKARDLAGKSDLLFWRNAETGRVECLTNKSQVELNSELHRN